MIIIYIHFFILWWSGNANPLHSDQISPVECVANTHCVSVGFKVGNCSVIFGPQPQISLQRDPIVTEAVTFMLSWPLLQINKGGSPIKIPAGWWLWVLPLSTLPQSFSLFVVCTWHFALITLITVFISSGNSRPNTPRAPGVIRQCYLLMW